MNVAERRPGASRLALAASMIALTAASAAHAQTVRRAEPVGAEANQRPVRTMASNWSFDLRTTYSDNYRRLSDDSRRTFFVPDGTGGLSPLLGATFVRNEDGTLADPNPDGTPQLDIFRVRDTVEVDPPSNVIFTAGLRGGTVYERPGLSGILTGGVTVSLYSDDTAIDERLSDALAADISDGVIPEDGFLLPLGTTLDDVTDRTLGFDQDEEIFIRPDIAGSVTARLFEDVAYVDIAALAQQQTISGRDQVAVQGEGELGNATTFVGGSVSPYLTRDIGGGRAEARYRFSGVIVADEQFDGSQVALTTDEIPDDDQRFANDSIAHEALIEYQTGQFFDRFGVLFQASAARSDETGSDILPEIELTRLTALARGSYALGRTISLTGTAGVDDVSLDETRPNAATERGQDGRDDAFSGFFWSAGVEAVPTRRTRMSLAVGERFGGTQINGELSYRPTQRINVSARADRELGTGTQGSFAAIRGLNSRTLEIVQQLAEIQSGSSGELLDRVVSAQGGFSNGNQQTAGVAVRNTYSLRAAYNANRTSFSTNVRFSTSEFGGEGQTQDNKQYSIGANARRQVSRRITIGINGRFERTEGILPEEVFIGGATEDQTSDQIFLSADAAYRIGPRLSATARAYHTDSEGLVGIGTGREYTENAVSAGIRWTF